MVGRRAATLAVSAATLAALLAGCSSSGGDEKAATTTTAAETTTTETGPDLEAIGADVQDLLETADQAIDDEIAVRDGFAADNDLQSGIDSTRDLRQALYDFDGELRALELPDDLSKEVNAVLTANGGFIDVLDGYLEIEDIPAYNDQLDREAEARDQWYEAVGELADALEIDGVENDISGSSTGDDNPVSDDEEQIAAGDIAGDDLIQIQVPEGFTAAPGFPIEMTDANGNTIGVYVVYDEDPSQSLEDRADEYAAGVADKNGFEIIGGPESDDIGDYPAIGYAFATDDTHTEVVFAVRGRGRRRPALPRDRWNVATRTSTPSSASALGDAEDTLRASWLISRASAGWLVLSPVGARPGRSPPPSGEHDRLNLPPASAPRPLAGSVVRP
ncbi:MAG: hypothetical protein R2711_12100 [Acidimicrobiales bacterium]